MPHSHSLEMMLLSVGWVSVSVFLISLAFFSVSSIVLGFTLHSSYKIISDYLKCVSVRQIWFTGPSLKKQTNTWYTILWIWLHTGSYITLVSSYCYKLNMLILIEQNWSGIADPLPSHYKWVWGKERIWWELHIGFVLELL